MNTYLTHICEGQVWREVHIEFWLLEGNSRSRVRAVLPSHGSLGPLFYQCNLITKEQLTAGFGEQLRGAVLPFSNWPGFCTCMREQLRTNNVFIRKHSDGTCIETGQFGISKDLIDFNTQGLLTPACSHGWEGASKRPKRRQKCMQVSNKRSDTFDSSLKIPSSCELCR